MLFYVMYILLFIVVCLIGYSIFQLNIIGVNIKDFWSFIEANQMLDKLYAFSKEYEKFNVQEQIIYLSEAEKIFSAFDKVPNILWEEEYDKYYEVLNQYKKIKMLRWASN